MFTAALTAATLLAWLRLPALDGDLARAEPKTMRYRVLRRPTGPQRPPTTPQNLRHLAWAPVIVTAWDRISALAPAP